MSLLQDYSIKTLFLSYLCNLPVSAYSLSWVPTYLMPLTCPSILVHLLGPGLLHVHLCSLPSSSQNHFDLFRTRRSFQIKPLSLLVSFSMCQASSINSGDSSLGILFGVQLMKKHNLLVLSIIFYPSPLWECLLLHLYF